MKKIAIILSFIIPIFCSAQTIHFDDRETPYSIYIGVVNTVTIIPAVGMNMDELDVFCVNCQIEKKESSDNGHLVLNIKPDKGFTKAQIEIRDKKGVLIKEENFQISRLPTCEIFIGNQSTGENINKENLKLSVGYPSEISLKIALEILSWEVVLDDKTYSGQGGEFTDDVILAIKQSTKGQILRINSVVLEKSTGISRELNAAFKVVK